MIHSMEAYATNRDYIQDQKAVIRGAARAIMEWEPKGYQIVMELFLDILGQKTRKLKTVA